MTEETLKKTERTLERAKKKLGREVERNRSLREETQDLKKVIDKLEKQLGEAHLSDDFLHLKELYAEAEQLKAWRRSVVLPFGELIFRFDYGSLALELITSQKETLSHVGAKDIPGLLDLCEATNEAIQKRLAMADLQERIRPLAEIIGGVSRIMGE